MKQFELVTGRPIDPSSLTIEARCKIWEALKREMPDDWDRWPRPKPTEVEVVRSKLLE